MAFVNKKAYHEYEILETYSAGVQLQGYEVKAIRAGTVNLKGNFVHFFHHELFVSGIHISPYSYAKHMDIDPMRRRKLLLKKRELAKIAVMLSQKGITAVVLELFFDHNLVKAKIGLCRGKKLHDKRETQKQKDEQRYIEKSLKSYR